MKTKWLKLEFLFISALLGLESYVQGRLLHYQSPETPSELWIQDVSSPSNSLEFSESKGTTSAYDDKGGEENWDPGWFKTLRHPKFPDIAVRYKEPRLCDPSVKQYSGYLDVTDKEHLFFWFFESRNDPQQDPLVLWLNGGPGESSMVGLLFELGPCKVFENGSATEVNPFSWNQNASILFIDQPVGVGFSYGTTQQSSTSSGTAQDIYAFLHLFFAAFPKYLHLDLHLFGESYGGHFIPALGKVVNDGNRDAYQKELPALNLKSIGIGNGFVDPLIQYKYYPQMACNSSYDTGISPKVCEAMTESYDTCSTLILGCYKTKSPLTCLPASYYCNRVMLDPFLKTGLNPYDIRGKCEGKYLCYHGMEEVKKWLNSPEVKKELGTSEHGWENSDMTVFHQLSLSADGMRPDYVQAVSELLEANINVLVYAGDADFVCNWMGNKAWTLQLVWSGTHEYNAAQDHIWYIRNKQAGDVRHYGPLTFVKVFHAGHRVPYDKPIQALDMLNHWILKLHP